MDKERDILREKLRNYTPEPSRDLWSGIEASIQKKKKRPMWIWMAVAAAVTLLLALWLWPSEQVVVPEIAGTKDLPAERIDSVKEAQPLNQTFTEQKEPNDAAEKKEEKNTNVASGSTLADDQTSKKLIPKVPPLPKPKPQPRLVPKPMIAKVQQQDKATRKEPKTAQFASENSNDGLQAIVALADIQPIESLQSESVKTSSPKPTKVVIIRRAKPQKAKAKKRSFELNIGNTNLFRVTRKSTTTEHTTS